jgi:hypothetical protein
MRKVTGAFYPNVSSVDKCNYKEASGTAVCKKREIEKIVIDRKVVIKYSIKQRLLL